ncbi:N2,N2-dimethylguanosine tRNA methyltransferase-like protein [Tricladium varicosporioides]|nr:N2,N2-dimethylguanosine tRNA methyltransferase-like protein [Hymenoscyphus varicosporioides]
MLLLRTTIGRLARNYVTYTTYFDPARRLPNHTMAPTLPDISTTPAPDQHITYDGKDYTTIKEGLAHILIPITASKVPQTSPQGENQAQSVFYNPIQQFNRDLSVLAIKAYGEEVLERKKQSILRNREKLAAKRKEKKRKRENDGLSEGARKAGKLDGDAQPAGSKVPEKNVNQSADATLRQETEKGEYGDQQQTFVEDPVPTGLQESSSATAPADVQDTSTTNPEPISKAPSVVNSPFTILDALSATGLRALRYVQEIPFTTSVTANDLLPAATKTIKMNIKHNGLDEKIEALTGNATTHMYNVSFGVSKGFEDATKPRPKYDVIDLDPYGTVVPFLDAAVQAVRDDGGLLCVTCTDAGVWASNGYPEKSFSLYGGVPIKGQHSHEGGLRLILNAIATSAARYGLAMEPLLSLSIDFYARVFVKIHKSPADVKFLAGKTMVVYNCDQGCGAWTTQMVAKNKLAKNKNGNGYFWKHVFGMAPTASEDCKHCGMKTHMAGPMYAGPLHSPTFIKRILDDLPNISKDTYQTFDRIEGMLTVALEETLPPLEEDANSPTLSSKTGRWDPAAIDPYPFFFIPSMLSKVIHCITPVENAFRGALRHLGYRVTRSHCKPGTIKTDAPWEVVWEVMREWVKQKQPIREGAVKRNTAGYNILKLDEKDGSDPVKSVAETNNGNPSNGSTVNPKLDVVFDESLGKEPETKKLVRYQLNPRENWGPMNRAKG